MDQQMNGAIGKCWKNVLLIRNTKVFLTEYNDLNAILWETNYYSTNCTVLIFIVKKWFSLLFYKLKKEKAQSCVCIGKCYRMEFRLLWLLKWHVDCRFNSYCFKWGSNLVTDTYRCCKLLLYGACLTKAKSLITLSLIN